jgi:small subunit ribosomal protein S12
MIFFTLIFIFTITMSTTYQLIRRIFIKKKAHNRTPALIQCPQVKGTVRRCRIVTPRKPNSARRQVAKVMLVNKKRVTAFIPGIGHTLKSHSQVLVKGGGSRDLPGVRYSCVRGAIDLIGVPGKRRRRSVYGVKRPLVGKRKLRRKFRSL